MKKLFVAKEKKKREGKEKILDQVYTLRDSSSELQKKKLDAIPVGTLWDGVSIGRYYLVLGRVAEVAREHRWHPPKSLDSDENFFFVAN